MAKCNDNSKMSAEAVSACMRRCEAPLQEINQVVQQEVGGLQVSKHSLVSDGCTCSSSSNEADVRS